ncbi:hypothetical protein niasHT_027989 [Heterodera trifolii]|uniref:Uncharacterized protein n=1 Tax=Heterodera trifolii TaxID=157864 RepID=A0ABD2KEE8_9BILA
MRPRQFNGFSLHFTHKSPSLKGPSPALASPPFIHITTVHPTNPFQAKSSPPYPSSSLLCATWFCLLSFHSDPNVSIALPSPPRLPLYPPYILPMSHPPLVSLQFLLPLFFLAHPIHFTYLRQRQFSSFFVNIFHQHILPFFLLHSLQMPNFLLLNFYFLIAFFVALTQCQEFPPVQPVPAPPETQNQNLEENPETTTGMPPSVAETTVAPFDGPLQMKGLGGGEQIMTTTPQGNSSEPKLSSPTNGNEEKNPKTVAAGVSVSTTVATTNSPGNSFGTTETPLGTDEGPVVGEVELWSFADNLSTTTPSTITLDSTTLDTTTPDTSVDTTTDHSPPVPAAAIAQSTIAMLLMASSAILTVYAFFR